MSPNIEKLVELNAKRKVAKACAMEYNNQESRAFRKAHRAWWTIEAEFNKIVYKLNEEEQEEIKTLNDQSLMTVRALED